MSGLGQSRHSDSSHPLPVFPSTDIHGRPCFATHATGDKGWEPDERGRQVRQHYSVERRISVTANCWTGSKIQSGHAVRTAPQSQAHRPDDGRSGCMMQTDPVSSHRKQGSGFSKAHSYACLSRIQRGVPLKRQTAHKFPLLIRPQAITR
jgi:hypothetical protein